MFRMRAPRIASGQPFSSRPRREKDNSMQIPAILQGDALKRFLQGAAAGAVATVVIGFAWGGWTLGSTARQMADDRAKIAVVEALAPICVDKFQHATDATVNLAAFKKVDTWQRGDFIEKGGWATMPGSTTADSTVARACARALNIIK
jgi:hypothetical protein